MTDQTLPFGGGAYTRLPDGTLRLDEPPTALEAPAEAPAEAPVQTPVEGVVEDPVQRPVKAAGKTVKEA